MLKKFMFSIVASQNVYRLYAHVDVNPKCWYLFLPPLYIKRSSYQACVFSLKPSLHGIRGIHFVAAYRCVLVLFVTHRAPSVVQVFHGERVNAHATGFLTQTTGYLGGNARRWIIEWKRDVAECANTATARVALQQSLTDSIRWMMT